MEISETKPDEHLTPMTHMANNRCFGCGVANPTGLQLKFFLRDDGTVVCPASIPDAFEGPPGYLHGGIIATLLDEIMSKSVRSLHATAMTRHMAVDYLRPISSGATIRLEGRVVRSEGRKHWAEAQILDSRSNVVAHSKGLFIEVRIRPQKAAE